MSQSLLKNPFVSSAPVLTGTGNGTLVVDRLTHYTATTTYTATCIGASPATFTIVPDGEASVGLAVAGTPFFDLDLKIFLTITQGLTPFVAGDYFTFSVTAGTDLSQTNIDAYDELPQKNFGAGTLASTAGDHNLRYSNTSLYASLYLQDLKFTAVTAGSTGDSITVAYTTGATAGSEVVSVVSSAISVQISTGVSTATQVKAALDASGAAAALISTSIIGLAANPQVGAVSATNLYGGKNKSFALNHNELTDSGSFVEGNTNLKAKDANLLGNLDVTGHAHLKEALSLNDAVSGHSSGNAIPNVQKTINQLMKFDNSKILVDTVGSAILSWTSPNLTSSGNIEIRFKDSTVVNTVSMVSGFAFSSDGDSLYAVLDPDNTKTVTGVVAATVPTGMTAFRIATRFGTSLITYNGTLIISGQSANIGGGGSTSTSTANAGVRRDASGDFAAHDITANKSIVGSGSGKGVDVGSAGNLEIGASVGANDVALGGSSSTVTIKGGLLNGVALSPLGVGTNLGATDLILGGATTRVVVQGDLDVQGATTTIETTNLAVKDKLVTLNKAGTAASATGSGIEFEENSAITGYVKTSADRNSVEVKAPNTAGVLSLTPGASADVVVARNTTDTLTNKTIDGDDNTVRDLPITSLKTNVTDASKFMVRDGSGVPTSATKAVPSGVVVGTTDTQVLTNKTFDDAITGKQISTPSNPSSGYDKLYFKSDNKLYKLTSAGAEVEVGSGTGSGAKNYINNGNFEDGTITGWTATGVATVTNGLPVSVGSGAAAFSSSNGGRTKGANTSSPAIDSSSAIAGTYCLNLATTGAGTIGDGYISSAYTIDKADQAKVLAYKLYYKSASGAPVMAGTSANTYAVAIYDVANNAWLGVAGNFNFVQSSGVGIAQGTFQTASNTTSIQIFIYSPVAPVGASSLLIDDVYVGPQAVFAGPTGPVGEIIATGSLTAPGGFLYCDGTAVSRTQFADLFAVIGTTYGVGDGSTTFNLPNLKGVFARGAGSQTISAISYSATLGTTQGDQLQGHKHLNIVSSTGTDGSDGGYKTGNGATPNTTAASQNSGPSTDGTNGTPRTGSETRPANVSVAYHIRYLATYQMSSDTDTRVVAAMAQYSVGASVSANTSIPYNVATFDTHGALTLGSGFYFRVPVSGFYEIGIGHASSTTNLNFSVYRNGINVGYYISANAVASINQHGACIVQAVAGDTLDTRADSTYATAGGSAVNYVTFTKKSGPATIAASESVNAVYTGLPTGTLNSSFNIATYPTKANDSHSAYSSGTYTVSTSGAFSISAGIDIQATFTAGQSIGISIFVNGVEKITNYWFAGSGSNNEGMPQVSVQGFKLLAGDAVTIRSKCAGSSPVFAGTTQNYFSIAKVGN